MPALKEIKAVHIADLESVLARYGQDVAFKSGAMNCIVCGDTITPENAGSIKFTKGKPSLACSKLSCYHEIVKIIMQ